MSRADNRRRELGERITEMLHEHGTTARAEEVDQLRAELADTRATGDALADMLDEIVGTVSMPGGYQERATQQVNAWRSTREHNRPACRGPALGVLRHALGLGAEQVAHTVGISTQRLGAIETGADEPTQKQITPILVALAALTPTEPR